MEYSHVLLPEEGATLATFVRQGPKAAARFSAKRYQRRRVLAGMVAATAARGYTNVSVSDVVAAARVSRTTFYEHFDTKLDCYLASYDACIAELRSAVGRSATRLSGHARLEAMIGAYLAALAAFPEAARTCLVEVYAVGPEGIHRRAAHHRPFVEAFAQVHADLAASGGVVGPVAAFELELLVNAISSTVTARVAASETASLPELTAPLVAFVRRVLGGGR